MTTEGWFIIIGMVFAVLKIKGVAFAGSILFF